MKTDFYTSKLMTQAIKAHLEGYNEKVRRQQEMWDILCPPKLGPWPERPPEPAFEEKVTTMTLAEVDKELSWRESLLNPEQWDDSEIDETAIQAEVILLLKRKLELK